MDTVTTNSFILSRVEELSRRKAYGFEVLKIDPACTGAPFLIRKRGFQEKDWFYVRRELVEQRVPVPADINHRRDEVAKLYPIVMEYIGEPEPDFQPEVGVQVTEQGSVKLENKANQIGLAVFTALLVGLVVAGIVALVVGALILMGLLAMGALAVAMVAGLLALAFADPGLCVVIQLEDGSHAYIQVGTWDASSE